MFLLLNLFVKERHETVVRNVHHISSRAFEAHDVISTRFTALLEQKESIATSRFQDRSIMSTQKENLDLFQKKEIMERLGIKAVRI